MKLFTGLDARARLPAITLRWALFTVASVVGCVLVFALLARLDPAYRDRPADRGDDNPAQSDAHVEAAEADTGKATTAVKRTPRHTPAWVAVPRTVAHTMDGAPVVFRVSVDVQTRSARHRLEADQLPLHLQQQVASMTRAELSGAAGQQTLTQRMLAAVRQRIHDAGDDAEAAVHCLAIEELLIDAR